MGIQDNELKYLVSFFCCCFLCCATTYVNIRFSSLPLSSSLLSSNSLLLFSLSLSPSLMLNFLSFFIFRFSFLRLHHLHQQHFTLSLSSFLFPYPLPCCFSGCAGCIASSLLLPTFLLLLSGAFLFLSSFDTRTLSRRTIRDLLVVVKRCARKRAQFLLCSQHGHALAHSHAHLYKHNHCAQVSRTHSNAADTCIFTHFACECLMSLLLYRGNREGEKTRDGQVTR